MEDEEAEKKKRGFALMNPDRRREICKSGGQSAHAKGTAHQFDKEEAREAGRKGGQAVSADREHMAHIGRLGGRARARRRAEDKAVLEVVSRDAPPPPPAF